MNVQALDLGELQQAHTLVELDSEAYEVVTQTVVEPQQSHMQTVVYRLKPIVSKLSKFEEEFLIQLQVNERYIRTTSDMRVYCKRSNNPDDAALVHDSVVTALKAGKFIPIPEIERVALGLSY